MRKENLIERLSLQVRRAVDLLVEHGFAVFTNAKFAEMTDPQTGLRRRSFQSRSRHDLVLVLDRAAGAKRAAAAPAAPAAERKPVEAMTVKELREEASGYPELAAAGKMDKKTLAAAVADARGRREILFRKF